MTTNISRPIFIQSCGFHSAMGSAESEIHQCLNGQQQANMVTDTRSLNTGAATVVGQVSKSLPAIPTHLSKFNTRNNQLALSALLQIEESVQQAIEQFGHSRIAVVIGTSTSGISDGEVAYQQKIKSDEFPSDYHYRKQELGNTSEFIAQYFDLSGPCYAVSTACSSSGRVFITAQRLLRSGIVDAVIVGGVDTLCRLTLNGFHGLEALSQTLCQPFSANRNGINIGESAALMLLSNEPSTVALLGAGDSSDAHHISAPHPEGNGAEVAMQKALTDASLTADDIGYINAHGTATPLNDSMESKAIYRLFGSKVPVSSTKPLTGHTLGAASATEAAIAWHILKHDLELPIQHCQDKADDIEVSLVEAPTKLAGKAILSNSFAFGGNNISLIFGYTHD
ncbi:3-oxoacyl-(acyl carrier protein) synthase I [Vibrio orientalis CIP 102891 = ATCC 33934]|uniref:3-oxoacyl-(Acyl carrier protein) synthase I n=2 Tax=Vibrio orientalis CIP 102891 = ATCC 33934 TaxID=675816 RepID=F9ST45_VIBOR|nr:beta-ketoacyl-[acyl-carrier-protein] synthase family protein [Vibrio orientalis]EGU50406.1 3-oxoacyl-(acyl carrier protein) synthase I [Vibrio orientalis CIP 102891 = ATCC 33934]